MRRLSATPCPVTDYTNRRDSIFSVGNDTTANLDFTTEFKASFRNVKPRRPPAATKKRAGNNAAWTIHEDEELKLEPQSTTVSNDIAQLRPSHSQQRRVSFAQPDAFDGNGQQSMARPATNLSKAPRRLSTRAPNPTNIGDGDDTLPPVPASKISKPARRGTVYIPSDDTTMPTMFMDMFSPLRKMPPPGTIAPTQSEPDMTGLAVEMQRKKGPRKSILAASPKRGPLQPSSNAQSSSVMYDRFGQGPGKENVPPGSNESTGASKDNPSCDKKVRAEVHVQVKRPRPSTELPSRLFEPTASSNARLHEKVASRDAKPKPAWNSNFLLPKPPKLLRPAATIDDFIAPPTDIEPSSHNPSIPRRALIPAVVPDHLPEYEFLPEGVKDASMYEEGWLGQQEIALTQLINQLFSAASLTPNECSHNEMQRIRLSEYYGTPSIASLYKRLQESLSHGSLGMSQAVLVQGNQLYADLGRRRSFTDFWLSNYNTQHLQSCLEVVVGRVVPLRTSGSGQSPNAKETSREERALKRFIEKFLLRNEDATGRRESTTPPGPLFLRTVLRSLMLVKLLDVVKSEASLQTKAMLFKTSSALKSSATAVTCIMQMLNPSGGDPTRTLRSIGYQVCHVQYPLEEYDYSISNLAVDLRDGVRLTRLVELLLYRSASQSLGHVRDLEATTTITISTGHTVTLGEGQQDWPLSQHLKLPCIGRATKIYNMQLALSALKEVKGMSAVLQNIEPADIVDGFREKTVRLLWVLSSKWGLGGLVDWKDVRSEIKRLGRSIGRIGHLYLEEFDFDDDEEGYMQYKSLLKVWVKAVAAAWGLRVRNFTSDFADGRLFGALISEYQPLLTSFGHDLSTKSLSGRLRALGCSDEFCRLFTPIEGNGQQIFDRDFVLASIAFLCSRLLSPTKKARAAVTLQRAWRKRWDSIIAGRKKTLRGVARDCVTEVRMRKAKACIWRAWCEFRARRHAHAPCQQDQSRESDIWLSL